MKCFDAKTNKRERTEFVKIWAEYVRTHSDADWSMQQKVVVDSQLKHLSDPWKK